MTYTINKTLLNIKQVHIVNWKIFIIVILDASNKIFIVYMVIRK